MPHECERPTCTNVVVPDDEPFCYAHAGADARDGFYSARANAELAARGITPF